MSATECGAFVAEADFLLTVGVGGGKVVIMAVVLELPARKGGEPLAILPHLFLLGLRVVLILLLLVAQRRIVLYVD